MTTGNTDIDTLASDPDLVNLADGTEVYIKRIKMLELLKLLRILSRGAGETLINAGFRQDMDPEEMVGLLLGAVVIAIPESPEDTLDFVRDLVQPKNAADTPALVEKWINPDPSDFFIVLEKVIRTEAPHFVALGKQLAVLFKAQTLSDTAKQKTSSKRKSAASTQTAS